MKIVFCRPGGSFSSDWVGCWTETVFHCVNKGIEFVDSPAVFHNIHMVRDLCLDINMGHIGEVPFKGKLDYTHLMWIDSDQIWTPEQIQKLIDHDEDIVCGWYAMNGTNGKGLCVGWFDEKVYVEKEGMPMMKPSELENAERNEKGLIDLHTVHPEYGHPWIGMGFMLVKKGVFEKLEYPWFYDDCVRHSNLIGNRGDDISFCKKAHEAGFKIYLDPEVRVGHQKLVVL